MPQERNAGQTCRVCLWYPAAMKGRCRTCDAYRRRTGRERPAALIARIPERNQLWNDRQQERQLIREMLAGRRRLGG